MSWCSCNFTLLAALAAQAVLVASHRICMSQELQEIFVFNPLSWVLVRSREGEQTGIAI